jgi:hypothetical protein
MAAGRPKKRKSNRPKPKKRKSKRRLRRVRGPSNGSPETFKANRPVHQRWQEEEAEDEEAQDKAEIDYKLEEKLCHAFVAVVIRNYAARMGPHVAKIVGKIPRSGQSLPASI